MPVKQSTKNKKNPGAAPVRCSPADKKLQPVQQASLILETCFDAALITDTAGTITYVNKACCDMLGYCEQELIGKAANFLYVVTGRYTCTNGEVLDVDQDHIKTLQQAQRALLKKGRSCLMPAHCVTKDGLAILVEQNSSFLYNKQGKQTGILSIMRDFSLQRSTQQALQASHGRFETLFELSLDSVILTDSTGCITMANPAVVNLLGYAHDEIIGRPMADVVLPGPGTYNCLTGGSVQIGQECVQEIQTMIARLFKEGAISQWQTWFVKKDHTALFIEQSLVALYDHNHMPVGLLAIIRDITEKTAMQDTLQKSEERFHTFFEYAPDAIYISDVNGIFLDGNRSAEQLTGYSRDELIGKNYFDLELLAPEQFPQALKLLERNINGNPTGPDEFMLQRRDGRQITVEICTYPLYLQGERCVLGVAHDITQRKQAETKLNKARKSLEIKVRERTQDLEEANTALRVLLKGRDEDRAALEESMLHNLHELVLPCIEKLRSGKLQERQRATLELLETNLRDITSPMIRSLSMQHLRFTPAESSVATCIRHGRSTREIADLLHLSIKTVHFHRENIRRKCGIKNKKVNLRTFLSSLA